MTNFRLPNTKTCVVVWYRNGMKNETLIDTPANMEALKNTMIMSHRVGMSEIRCLKAVRPADLASSMMGFRR